MSMSNSSYYDYHPTIQLERPVVLGGMPGTPYREVGHYLASLTGLSILDLDRWLEHQVGKSLWDFVQSEGEEVLRQKEFEYLDRALVAQPRGLLIVSEGTLAQAANRRKISESAGLASICLLRPLPRIGMCANRLVNEGRATIRTCRSLSHTLTYCVLSLRNWTERRRMPISCWLWTIAPCRMPST